MLGVATISAPLKLVLALDFDVSHNHRQHLFMYVDSRYPISHILSSWRGAESVPRVSLSRVTGYRRSPGGKDNAQLFGSTRTLRIRQLNSLNLSIENSISPLRASPILHSTRINFHELSRAVGPSRQLREVTLPFRCGDKRQRAT